MENFSEWYSEILERAEIYDVRYPIKGCGIYLPYGFKIRRYTLDILRRLLEERGHEEVLFPLLIPEDLLAKEGEHIKGFEDEVFWVTHGGKKPLEVKLALRPTSETAIYYMMKLWIKVHKDLPIKIYQVVNTFRYETKHTRPLIRLREIMTFKEAHTAHATGEEAENQVKEAIEIYKEFFHELGIPVMVSRRPEWDKFPGAQYTVAFDTIFPDGRAIQIGTVHNLGQNFSRTFDLEFETLEGGKDYVYQTCYGISDRVIASIIAIHGDEKGLVLPPQVAPIQVVIVPLLYKGKREVVEEKALELYKLLKEMGIRVEIDNRDIRPGRKFYHWELRGVPVRIEIGPKDLENKVVTIYRRDTEEKYQVRKEDIKEEILSLFERIKENMRERARERMERYITTLDFSEDTPLEEIVKEVRKNLKERKGVILIPYSERVYSEDLEEKVEASILGVTEYKGKKYVVVGRTY
ncbi:MAG TPA: proline--tRNA ligase [Methanothermococcus okinawensis]|uniref:Proline--tRNA ligase n=1 Tax=Methanothermococcus okinawensis TaxID=155863 RepID=A0A832ZZF0_9EURY|nr:proline--tRNA ligase [Methanothermococcus okinawensis]